MLERALGSGRAFMGVLSLRCKGKGCLDYAVVIGNTAASSERLLKCKLARSHSTRYAEGIVGVIANISGTMSPKSQGETIFDGKQFDFVLSAVVQIT